MKAVPDPVVQRPTTDGEVVIRAFNHLLKEETEMETYVRQQWEAAIGASRVALDAWRRIWPIEAADSLPADRQGTAREIEHHLAEAQYLLNTLSEPILGALHEALQGHLSHADLDAMGAARD